MTATDRARAALARNEGPLPWHALVSKGLLRELLSLAEYGEHHRNEHACQECGECLACEENACSHGRLLCINDRWSCRECSVDLEDDLAAELAHDMAKEGA